MAKKIAWDSLGDDDTGSPPDGYSLELETETLVSNEVVVDGAGEGGKSHEIVTHATNDGEIIFTLESMGITDAVELLGKLRTNNTTGQQFKLIGRLEEVGGEDAYYSVGVEDGTDLVIRSVRDHESVVIDSVGFVWTADTYYWMRVQMYGDTIRARIWEDGNSEPETWTLTAVNAPTEGGDPEATEFVDPETSQVPNQILLDTTNRRLIAYYASGLYCWDLDTGSLLGSYTGSERPEYYPSGWLDDDGHLWMAEDAQLGKNLRKYLMPNCTLGYMGVDSGSGEIKSMNGIFDINSIASGKMAVIPNDYGVTIFDDDTDLPNRTFYPYYGTWNGCCYDPLGVGDATTLEWSDPPYPEMSCFDGTRVWVIGNGDTCDSDPSCETYQDDKLFLHGFDVATLTWDKAVDITSSMDNPSGKNPTLLVYDDVNNCLVFSFYGDVGDNYVNNIAKFSLSTFAVVDSLDDGMTNYCLTTPCSIAYDGKLWLVQSNMGGDNKDFLQRLDIATMTFDRTIQMDDIGQPDGVTITGIDDQFRFDPSTESLIIAVAGTGTEQDQIWKVSLASDNSDWIRLGGKSGWGAGGNSSTVRNDWHSNGKGKPAPGPGDVDGDSGLTEFKSPYRIIGPGSFRKSGNRGRGLKI